MTANPAEAPDQDTLRFVELTRQRKARYVATNRRGGTIEVGEGDDATSTPVELLLTAIAACSAMDVVSILAKKRQRIESYNVEVEATQRDEYPQVLTRIDIVHDVVGPRLLEAAVRRAVELSATKYCPVNAMLSAGATEVHHRYRARCTGDPPLDASGEVAVTGPDRRPDIVE